MTKGIFVKLKRNVHFVLNLTILVLFVYLILVIKSADKENKDSLSGLAKRLDNISESQFRDWQSKHPKVTSNQDFNGEKSNFTFSPDKKLIAFVQNVFEEYGSNWDRYWALKIFNPETDEEKILVVDDTRMSAYEWFNNNNLRVFHNAGTGVRVYLNVSVNKISPLFTKDYNGPEIWTPDMEYAREAKDTVEARWVYFEKTQQ